MTLLRPTRRELIGAAPLLLGAAALPGAAFAAPAGPPLNFLVVGDWGRDGKDFQRHVAMQMGRTARDMNSAFVVSTGDNFYTFGVSSKHDRQWRSSFEDIYNGPLGDTPWYPVLGNHDYGGDVGAQVRRKQIDSRWRMDDLWYDLPGSKIGHPGVDLFFINTVVWIGKEGLPFLLLGSDIKRGQKAEQETWLDAKLRDSTAPVKLVFGHHPIYSVGPHGGKIGLDSLDRMLRRHKVTAYVNGHDHCLYHISARDETGHRMHYICSGAGSQILTGYTGGVEPGCVLKRTCPPPSGETDLPLWHSFLSIAGFAAFQARAERAEFQFIDMAGHVRHSSPI